MDKNLTDNGCQQQKRVLIISAPIGSGHEKAAKAMHEQLQGQAGVDVFSASVFDFMPGIFGKALLSSYLLLLRIFPDGYACLYTWGERSHSLVLRNFVNRLFSFGGSKFIKKIQPDVVIVTHFTPAGIASLYKKENDLKLPLIGIITDYAMHTWWLYKEIDTYVVVDQSIFIDYKKELLEKQEILPLGIPVGKQFNEKKEKDVLRAKLDLPQKTFICLVTGGGEGLLPIKQIIDSWQKNKKGDIFFVAVCGRNRRLEKQLLKLALPNARVLGFIDNMAEYMQAADVLLSKAGGVTSTEAIVCNLPVLLYQPLPGQEVINTRYLLTKGLVVIAKDISEVCDKLAAFAADAQASLAQVRQQQKKLAKPFAAEQIAKRVSAYFK